MTNLLALLLSLAMLMTGAPAGELEEPVTRTLTIENIEITHGEDALMLQPTITLAVQTDGSAAAFDFCITRDEEKLLPLQLAANADGLLLAVGDDVYSVPPELIGLSSDGDGGEMGAMLDMYRNTLNVYREMFSLMRDPEALAAYQARADQFYDEMVDRGAGVQEQLVYEGETYDVTSYEYDLTSEQMGALIEAVYADNPALTAYSEAYFEMLKSMPEEAGFAGVDSWASMMAMIDAKAHVIESRAESGLKVQDVTMSTAVPGQETPMTCTVHSVKNGDSETATANSTMDSEAMSLEMYAEYTRQGAEIQLGATITGNPSSDAEAAGEQAENGEALESDVEDADGGESDGEDLLYCTFDFSHVPDESTNFEMNLDVAGGTHSSFSIDTQPDGEGGALSSVALTTRVSEDDLSLSFDITQTDAPFEVRAVADDEDEKPEPLNVVSVMTALGADIEKLMQDEEIQQARQMLESAANPGEAPAADDTPSEGGGDLFNPEFTYLPAGFTQSDVIVDRDNRYVSLTFANPEAGVNLYVSLGDAQSEGTLSRYVVGPDGACAPLEGLLVTREDYGTYAMYTAEKDGITYSVFPDGGDISPEEVVKLLGGIRFN